MTKKTFFRPVILIFMGGAVGCTDTSLQDTPSGSHRDRKGVLCDCLQKGTPIKNNREKNVKARIPVSEGNKQTPSQQDADSACRDRVKSLNSENYFPAAIPETEVTSVPAGECKAPKDRDRSRDGKGKGGAKS